MILLRAKTDGLNPHVQESMPCQSKNANSLEVTFEATMKIARIDTDRGEGIVQVNDPECEVEARKWESGLDAVTDCFWYWKSIWLEGFNLGRQGHK